ncbi:MAG: hypothetical protein GY839_08565 [candidate division Zixibacteria bacterium]|nr:hypothetical protein [candidate division Zixibacteria bacterium]
MLKAIIAIPLAIAVTTVIIDLWKSGGSAKAEIQIENKDKYQEEVHVQDNRH